MRCGVDFILMAITKFFKRLQAFWIYLQLSFCGSPPGVIVADTLSFNAKIGVVDF